VIAPKTGEVKLLGTSDGLWPKQVIDNIDRQFNIIRERLENSLRKFMFGIYILKILLTI
jgi:hypothetical protein